MEALYKKERPQCNSCCRDGVILDRHMRGVDVLNVDVLEVKDYEDWGLFVMFDCMCCNNGYSWFPRWDAPIETEEEGRSFVTV